MHYHDILDLRDLANDWRDLGRGRDLGEFAPYVDLCADLGIAATPDDLERYGDSSDPTLIAEDYFETYARELADDIGAIPDNRQWPLTCIDWEHAARELAYDYWTVEYDGTTYLTRSC